MEPVDVHTAVLASGLANDTYYCVRKMIAFDSLENLLSLKDPTSEIAEGSVKLQTLFACTGAERGEARRKVERLEETGGGQRREGGRDGRAH